MSGFDPSTDYTVFDGTETVTLTTIASRTVSDAGVVGSTDTATALVSALRRAVAMREVEASNGFLRVGDTRWHFAVDALGAIVPRSGDKITATSPARVYRIFDVDEHTLSTRYRCWARPE